MFGLVAAFFGIGGSILRAVHCRERIIMQPKPAATTKTLFYILKNKYLLRNFLAEFFSDWWTDGGYKWDVVTQMEIFGGVFRTVPWYMPRTIVPIISFAFVEPFKRMFGGSYRKTVIFMRSWDFLVDAVTAALSLTTGVTNTWWKAGLLFAVREILNKSNDAPSTVLEDEIKREINDYTEYMTGERPDGTVGLLTGLLKKVNEPLKTLLSIAIIKWSGYDPNIASDKKWSQDVVRANGTMYARVFFLYNLENIAKFFFSLIPMFLYDLEGEKKEAMYVALNERRAMLASGSALSAEMEALIGMAQESETEPAIL